MKDTPGRPSCVTLTLWQHPMACGGVVQAVNWHGLRGPSRWIEIAVWPPMMRTYGWRARWHVN